MRRLPSRLANRLIGRVTGVRLHDYGCTLKAYRADVIQEMRLYGEMHRFLPALAYQAGRADHRGPGQHHPRVAGKSKYGLGRTFKVLLDLLTVKFLSVSTKPSYVFGGSGVVLCFVGVAVRPLDRLPGPVQRGLRVPAARRCSSASSSSRSAFNLILLGLLAELIVRTYHESQSKPVYIVRERRNIDEQAPPGSG